MARGSAGSGTKSGKKAAASDRAARLEAVRSAQRAGERRRTMLVVGGAGALVAVLVALVAIVVVRDQRAQDPARVGVAASAASCDPTQTLPATGVSEHIGPGTPTPDVTHVDYSTVPAVFGKHLAQPAYPAKPFYTPEDAPPVEQLVHNLEHGYTVVWYSDTLPAGQRSQLQDLADKARADDAIGGKFIVAPWDASRGAFPDGRTVGLAHWGAKDGYLQLCGAVSGQAITAFAKAHPASDSPEPNAA